MPMHNPPHPGEVIREICLEPLGLTVTETARGLGVSRKTLSELLNGHSGIPRRWRYAFPGHLAGILKAGCASRCNSTSGRPGGMRRP